MVGVIVGEAAPLSTPMSTPLKSSNLLAEWDVQQPKAPISNRLLTVCRGMTNALCPLLMAPLPSIRPTREATILPRPSVLLKPQLLPLKPF